MISKDRTRGTCSSPLSWSEREEKKAVLQSEPKSNQKTPVPTASSGQACCYSHDDEWFDASLERC